MGNWSTEPWGNDAAADWFHRFWTRGGVSFLADEIEDFDPRNENYDAMRAAAYLLQTLGIVYIWPGDAEKLKQLLDKSINILSNMIDPPNEDWTFLDMGGDKSALTEAVREQIAILQKRRDEIKT